MFDTEDEQGVLLNKQLKRVLIEYERGVCFENALVNSYENI